MGRVAGVDLGDVHSQVSILDGASGDVLEVSRNRTRPEDVARFFARYAPMRVAVETGTHSAWVERTLRRAGHVAHAARVRLVHAGPRKNELDAEKLARLLRYDASLVGAVQHRSERVHTGLAVLRSRDILVRARTALVSHVRGVVKTFGHRVPTCTTQTFARRARASLPPELSPVLAPAIDTIEGLTGRIRTLDARIDVLCRDAYPETATLLQVHGVGPITALAFVLTLEGNTPFRKARDVGAYLGLVPGQRQSGGRDRPQGISKTGDRHLRRLLVQCAQYVLSRRCRVDSDLRRHGLRIAASGTNEAKRRAVIAVARKLAVLLYALWTTGEAYDPLRNSTNDSLTA